MYNKFNDWLNEIFSPDREEKDLSRFSVKESFNFCTELFNNTTEHFKDKNLIEANQIINFLVSGNSLSDGLRSVDVSENEKIEFVKSTYSLNRDFFLPNCPVGLSHLNQVSYDLNGICYMFWDALPYFLDPADTANAAVNFAILGTLEQTLRLPSIPCIEGALHGLGHAQMRYPNEVEIIIDKFLNLHDDKIPLELKIYAQNAKLGNIA